MSSKHLMAWHTIGLTKQTFSFRICLFAIMSKYIIMLSSVSHSWPKTDRERVEVLSVCVEVSVLLKFTSGWVILLVESSLLLGVRCIVESLLFVTARFDILPCFTCDLSCCFILVV